MDEKIVNILIVDDDVAARSTFGKILKLKGHNVEMVGTGQESISLIKTRFFNIIFVDIKLPDTNGIEVLKAIREINEDTIVIMATAYASIDSSIEAMNRGAYSYVTKPINVDQVLATVDKALEKQQLSLDNKRLVQELMKANAKLEALALTDELTGLRNRRGFQELANQELKIAIRHKMNVSLLFVDLDKLKQINDSMGHPQGDKALIAIATVIKSTCRESDIVARVGGDEFAILALDLSGEKSHFLLERLHQNLGDYNKKAVLPYSLSMSIGVVTCAPEEICAIDELLTRADKLMYEKKRKKIDSA